MVLNTNYENTKENCLIFLRNYSRLLITTKRDLYKILINGLISINSSSKSTEEKENLKKFLRGEFDKNEEIIKLDSNSSMEDIYNFLKKILNFSDKAIENIKEQDLDPETFFSLSEDDINNIEGISEPEKEKLNIYLTEQKKEQREIEIKLIKEVDNENTVVQNLKEKSNSTEEYKKKEDVEPKNDLNEIIIEKNEHKNIEDKNDDKKNQS